MKITESQLRKIVREEITKNQRFVNESLMTADQSYNDGYSFGGELRSLPSERYFVSLGIADVRELRDEWKQGYHDGTVDRENSDRILSGEEAAEQWRIK